MDLETFQWLLTDDGQSLLAEATNKLAASIAAARKGQTDLVIGNLLGSNIFNVFLCLGAAGLAGPVGAPLRSVGVDLAALVLMTLLAVAFILRENQAASPLVPPHTWRVKPLVSGTTVMLGVALVLCKLHQEGQLGGRVRVSSPASISS